MKKIITKKFQPITFDRYPTKIKCTFRQNDLSLNDFETNASQEYIYNDTYEEDGCKVSYSIRINGKYPNRVFHADYPTEISVHGNQELLGIRFAAIMPMNSLKLEDTSAIRTEYVKYSDEDISILATFEISNENIIKASRQKMKKH